MSEGNINGKNIILYFDGTSFRFTDCYYLPGNSHNTAKALAGFFIPYICNDNSSIYIHTLFRKSNQRPAYSR